MRCFGLKQQPGRMIAICSGATCWLLCIGLMLAAASIVRGNEAGASTNKTARVKVSGFGFLGNREMVRLLRNSHPEDKFPEVFDRNFMEDAALVLFSRVNGDGYLIASLAVEFTTPDGERQSQVWTNALQVELPREFAATEVSFRMRKGVRFYYQELRIDGVEAISERQARSYFVSGDTLLRLRANRSFTPEKFDHSIAALKEALLRLGYRNVSVTAKHVERDDESGALRVELQVDEGLPTIVHSVSVKLEAPEGAGCEREWTLRPDAPYSLLWQQNLARELQSQQFVRGFPDASVEFSIGSSATNEASIQVDLAAEIKAGPRIRTGEVKFIGNKRTRATVVESRLTVKEGAWLNRIVAEESRQRLGRLGVFESVGLRFEEADAETRNVIYELRESKPVSLSLLAGYGSYELLRGGLEFEHRNVLGMAHDIHMRGLQSFKSTSGDFQYTVPEMFGENMDVYLKGTGLRREEITFTREEYGGVVGVQKRLEAIQTDFGAHYDYEFLNAINSVADTNLTLGVTDARSAAIVLDLNHDRRETPLLPVRGLKLFARVEAASAALGGNVDYQRFILGGSFHLDLGGGRLVHVGGMHGVSFTWGGSPEELPFNKRYFPGGENSVRGYQEGEASPLDENGNQLGAETFTQGNVEFEQLLTKSLSVVAFFDAVGIARDRADYPWDEELFSAGGGIRWRTVIGPVRLEYGRNLNPRSFDPSGTLHFSIGFPF